MTGKDSFPRLIKRAKCPPIKHPLDTCYYWTHQSVPFYFVYVVLFLPAPSLQAP